MSTRSEKQFLKVQLLETQRLKEMVAEHPLMSISFAERERELQERIAALPRDCRDLYDSRVVTMTKDEPVQLPGVFKGVLLESWRFDFVTDANHAVSGKIDENLTEDQVVELNKRFFNSRCLASLVKTTVFFKNGRARTTYVLRGLETLNE